MRPTALITGASSGIGEALAHLFANADYNLVLVARSQDKLSDLAGQLKDQHSIDCHVIPTDLSTFDGPQKLFDECQKKGLTIDCLVNNAGMGGMGAFAEQDVETIESMVFVNIRALTKLSRLFLPSMIERGKGEVLNVASTAAFQPGPFMSVYYATKAYVLSFSEALANEVKTQGIRVTCLCPGPTETDFFRAGNIPDAMIKKVPWLQSSQEVAENGFRALQKGKPVTVSGAMNRVLAGLSPYMPRKLLFRTIRRLHKH